MGGVEMFKIYNVVMCEIVRRANRFVVDVLVDGRLEKAYINNTGRLLEFMVRGRRAYCLRRARPGKTRYRLFAVHDMGAGALIDTKFQSRAFEKALLLGLIPWLDGCEILRREARLDDSVIDYLLRCGGKRFYLETKSAVFRGDGHYAMYPDCPTERGRRHVRTLIRHALSGGRAAVLFVAALPNVKAFKPYVRGDPVIFDLLLKSVEVGVGVRAINIYYDPSRSSVVFVDGNMDVCMCLSGWEYPLYGFPRRRARRSGA